MFQLSSVPDTGIVIKTQETTETSNPFKVSSVLCTVNENDNNREQVIQAAHSMFMRLGLKSVSMDDIAREMGISKKTIYQVVENKEQLITLVLEQDTCEDIRVINQNHQEAKDAIDESLRNTRYFIRAMREISPTTLRDLQKYYPSIWKEQMEAHHEEFRNSVARNIERGMEEGLYRGDLDADLVSRLYVGMMMMVIDRSVFPARERTISEIITQLSLYHFNGIVNQFGRERVEKYLKKQALE